MDKSTKAIRRSDSARRVPAILVTLSSAVAVMLLVSACGKSGAGSSGTEDPQMQERLTSLTHELHYTMAGRKMNRDFDEFVALRKLEVPPPPPGKKYAINEKWKVVLVDK